MKLLLLLLFTSSISFAQDDLTNTYSTDTSPVISKEDTEINDKSKLFEAVRQNDLDTVSQLLEQGVDPNSRDSYYRIPLMYADNKSLDIVELLLSKNAYINTRDSGGNTVLMIASEKGYTELVGVLLNYSILINLENRAGVTALHLAVQNGHTEVVKLLTAHSANITHLLPNNLPPIFEAVKKGYTTIAMHLIELGVNPNSTVSKTGTSLLSIASAYGSVTMVQMLLSKGADPNLPNKLGITPIFLSIGKGHTKITELLLDNGASTKLKTKDGLTVKDISNDTATLRLLKKYKK